MKKGKRQQLEDAAFEQALIQALSRAEAAPPAFLIPPDMALPEALVRSIRQVEKALDTSRSALRLAFGFLS